MKILVITNFYPPYFIGGYEIGCKRVIDGLKSRNHDIRVITSRFGSAKSDPESGIYRIFFHTFIEEARSPLRRFVSKFVEPILYPFRYLFNRKQFQAHVLDFSPDVVFFWNTAYIGTWLFSQAFKLRLSSACYISDSWLARGHQECRYTSSRRRPQSILNSIQLSYLDFMGFIFKLRDEWPPEAMPEMYFTSCYIAGEIAKRIPIPEGSEVIHWGVSDTTEQACIERHPASSFRIVYSGQLIEHKGVRTAILALSVLCRRHYDQKIVFRIAGGGELKYVRELKELVSSLNLGGVISFEGRLDQTNLRMLLEESDVFVFPSEWPEPFSISLLEGMISGCAVVSTTTGGSAEVVEDGENALAFPAGDSAKLADCLERLLLDAELRKRIARNGRFQVLQCYCLDSMISRIERKLTLRASRSERKHLA